MIYLRGLCKEKRYMILYPKIKDNIRQKMVFKIKFKAKKIKIKKKLTKKKKKMQIWEDYLINLIIMNRYCFIVEWYDN